MWPAPRPSVTQAEPGRQEDRPGPRAQHADGAVAVEGARLLGPDLVQVGLCVAGDRPAGAERQADPRVLQLRGCDASSRQAQRLPAQFVGIHFAGHTQADVFAHLVVG